jgi:ATP/maltotriose-dependent transcriptional regulator MalT
VREDNPSEDPELWKLAEFKRLELVAAGVTNMAIAERLRVSPGTIKKHLDNICARLGVANRAAAVARNSGGRAPPR